MEDKIGRTPKPGEIVMFNHRPTAQGGHKQSPAIVHSAGFDGVILTVFGIHGATIAQKVKEGAKPGEWQWPDDAAKTAEEKPADDSKAAPAELQLEPAIYPKVLRDPDSGYDRAVVDATDEADARDHRFVVPVA